MRWHDAQRGSLRVLLDELAHGEPLGRGLVVGELRDVLGRPGQLLAQQDFAHPVAPQDRAGARGARLLGERRRQAPGFRRARTFLTPSTRRQPGPLTAGDAVVLRQRFVQERVIAVEQPSTDPSF